MLPVTNHQPTPLGSGSSRRCFTAPRKPVLASNQSRMILVGGISHYAFTSTRSGKPQVWTMSSSTGGGLTRITNSTYGSSTPAWTH